MKNIHQRSLILVDGTSCLYRAYYAFPFFFNSKGKPSGAIYGVLNIIRSLFLNYNPYTMIIVFDSSRKNFRKKLYKKYKKNRLSMPENLKLQINPLYQVIEYLGIPLIIESNVEADDVIGTLSKIAEQENFSVLISSNDKDMAQLVNKNISIIDNSKKCVLGPKEIKKKYGVKAEYINHFLALTGDVSDNIPGVSGIGKKTALVLINKFKSIKNIYKNLKKIQELPLRGKIRIQKNLKKYQKIAFLSLKLTTIKLNVYLKDKIENMVLLKPKIKLLLHFFNYYEFSYLHKFFLENKWFVPNNHNCIVKKKENYEKYEKNYFNNMILDKKKFEMWLSKFKENKKFSFFFDLNYINETVFDINGITFSTKTNKFCYLVFKNNKLNIVSDLNINTVFKKLKIIFENPKIIKITENLKLQYFILFFLKIKICNIYFDTMLELHLFKYNKLSYDLTSVFITNNIFKYSQYEQLLENSNESINLDKIYSSKTTSLNHIKKIIKKSYFIFKTHIHIFPLIKKNKVIFNLYHNIDLPLVKTLFQMELNGVLIDCNLLKSFSKIITKKLIKLEKEAYMLSGIIFNLSSTKQIQKIFLKKKLFVVKNNKKFSTNKKVLLTLSKYDPLPKIILKYRSLRKLQSTYINKLPKMVRKDSKRIHTSYYQTITNTGRLSSKNPNLQNIPIDKKKEKNIRTAFIAPKNFIIMSADYSQIELRIIAHLSNDRALVHAFNTGKDIHSITASDLFHVNVNSVTFEQRKIAKTINFSVIYGISAFGLAQKLDIDIVAAEKYINLYFKKYNGVYKYIEKIKIFAARKGYVRTIDKRKLYIRNIQSSNKNYQKAAERVAVNAPIQGTAADIIKKAMIYVNNDLDQYFSKHAGMIMQVHDELVFEIRKEKSFYIAKHIQKIMESCANLNVPLKVNIKIGKNWNSVL
ncbi:DNA polymerase I [Buchnera aphidicola]|uniref:DNA polymerase I n=1 Tax=Buchnera aphidicola (Anoecia oenotherae) TaxID=1241833 RepID=A0A4D6XVE7_9GAMM|nr:DNA polymerase I [Buchnera aphidicola]QCI19447.1 DNA polymerase I [Buchnera aphidicola (Anoecia oenotherae)]